MRRPNQPQEFPGLKQALLSCCMGRGLARGWLKFDPRGFSLGGVQQACRNPNMRMTELFLFICFCLSVFVTLMYLYIYIYIYNIIYIYTHLLYIDTSLYVCYIYIYTHVHNIRMVEKSNRRKALQRGKVGFEAWFPTERLPNNPSPPVPGI